MTNTRWRSPETAPKDGTPILSWDGDTYGVVVWCGCRRRWLLVECSNNRASAESPITWDWIHWQPLPAPPEARDG